MLENKSNKMNWVKNPNMYDKFDKRTGEPIDYSGTTYTCPNEKWYNTHDKYFINNV